MSRERDKFFDFCQRFSYRPSENASIPLYYQLVRLCERFILERNLRSGERFPSEEAIAEIFGVSRPTVHRAVEELLARGWLERERGRGTFLAQAPHAEPILREDELSFSDRYVGVGELTSRIVDLSQGAVS